MRPGSQGFRPVWLDDATLRSYPGLDGDREVDVAVVGAGLTGLTTALLLLREGRSVAVLERHRVARAASAHTSGHLTAVLDLPFRTLVARFGEHGAQLAIRAGQQAIDTIEALSRELAPDAGFLRVPGFRWSERANEREELRDEARLAARLGLAASLVESTPLPFAVAAAIRFEDQALFHPLRYAAGLARAVVAAGGELYEDTAVEELEAGEPWRVHAGGHVVRARDVVHATQTPVGRVVSIQARIAPVTSYVVVARLAQPAPVALAWDSESPYHYLRPLQQGADQIVAGGGDHKTGQPDDSQGYAGLEAWLARRFPGCTVERRWSFGLYEPADGLPYIGRLGADGPYVAAGFAGTGLTFATVAAWIVRDEIVGRPNPLGDLLRASRVKALASAADVVRENADNAWHLLSDRLARPEAQDVAGVAPGQGCLVQIDGHKAAVHRDAAGRLHVLSPVCTHLGCVVHWNAAASTWDCPCHGGRFLPDGRVLYGPPTRALESVARPPAPGEPTSSAESSAPTAGERADT